MTVKILRGISGCGKSTLARQQAKEAEANGARVVTVSADDYFMVDGTYQFDFAKLGVAHHECLKRFLRHVADETIDLVIVDNTNIRLDEIAPYYRLAEVFDREASIVTVLCDPLVAFKRNNHGTPFQVIWGQYQRLVATTLPPYWQHDVGHS
jgi:tRNA uridine 5-carbamoylmethylation protein Kti12